MESLRFCLFYFGKNEVLVIFLTSYANSRLYDPQNGSILLDGTDIRSLDPRWLRKHIGAVNQEPVLFSGTIMENILYGIEDHETISQSELEQVLRDSHVDELASRFPNGLNCLVGQRGTLLSGGQKQRIAIARALIKVPFMGKFTYTQSLFDFLTETKNFNSRRSNERLRCRFGRAHSISADKAH